ncbi:hypothetical protein BJ165DRAFT_228536 [Panaeolus papilionaceus]|nr:hypothetical protein BJ165DRAFT_228536 [Panaeolus papilionaceus]
MIYMKYVRLSQSWIMEDPFKCNSDSSFQSFKLSNSNAMLVGLFLCVMENTKYTGEWFRGQLFSLALRVPLPLHPQANQNRTGCGRFDEWAMTELQTASYQSQHPQMSEKSVGALLLVTTRYNGPQIGQQNPGEIMRYNKIWKPRCNPPDIRANGHRRGTHRLL